MDNNGNSDYEDFRKVVEMFESGRMIKINIKFSDGQTAETEVMSIMKALEYIAQLAGKCFTNGTHIEHVEMNDVGRE